MPPSPARRDTEVAPAGQPGHRDSGRAAWVLPSNQRHRYTGGILTASPVIHMGDRAELSL
jgi:hypothetical protein